MSDLPLHNKEAETAVLGSMLRWPAAIDDVATMIAAESFYGDANRKLFAAMVDLRQRQKPVDMVTVLDELEARRQVEAIGGAGRLAQLWGAAPTATNVVHYAEIVKDHATLRGLVDAANEIAARVKGRAGSAPEMLDLAQRLVFTLSEAGTAGTTKGLPESIYELMKQVERRRDAKATDYVPTGLAGVDRLLAGGFYAGELIIVAARTSVGKSAFAVNCVRQASIRGFPTFVVSVEMSRVELAARFLTCDAKIDGTKLRRGDLSWTDERDLIESGQRYRDWAHVELDDGGQQTVARIASNARRLKLRKAIKLVVVDYVQLLEPEDKRARRYEQLGEISKRLKWLARELAVPVVALAQLNRGADERPNSKPRLADLRDSGDLEQNCDTAILLYKGERDNEVMAYVAKQRNGDVGEAPLYFQRPFQRFSDYEELGPELPFGAGL